MKAIRMHKTGGPEVLQLEEIDRPTLAGQEVLIKVAAAGVNHGDLMRRQGTYGLPLQLPAMLGSEVAGTVEVALR